MNMQWSLLTICQIYIIFDLFFFSKETMLSGKENANIALLGLQQFLGLQLTSTEFEWDICSIVLLY